MYEPRDNWTWELKSDTKVLANFKVGKDEYLWTARIIPNPFSESTTWEVLYQKKDRKTRTAFGFSGSESSVQVISNVVDITMTFLREYGDKVLEFRVSSEGNSRDKLYTRMARRLVPDWTTTKHKMASEIHFYVVNPRAQELRK